MSCCIWMIKEYSEHRARMVGCFVFSFWSFCVIMWFEGWRQHSFIDMLVIHFSLCLLTRRFFSRCLCFVSANPAPMIASLHQNCKLQSLWKPNCDWFLSRLLNLQRFFQALLTALCACGTWAHSRRSLCSQVTRVQWNLLRLTGAGSSWHQVQRQVQPASWSEGLLALCFWLAVAFEMISIVAFVCSVLIAHAWTWFSCKKYCALMFAWVSFEAAN